MDVAPGLLPLLRGPRLMPIYALASFAMIGVVGGWVGGMLLKSRGLGLAGNIAVGVIGALIGGVLVSAVGLAALGGEGGVVRRGDRGCRRAKRAWTGKKILNSSPARRGDYGRPLECPVRSRRHQAKFTAEEVRLLIENKYAAIAAAVGFLLTIWLTDGSMTAAFGVLALIAGIGWAVRRLQR